MNVTLPIRLTDCFCKRRAFQGGVGQSNKKGTNENLHSFKGKCDGESFSDAGLQFSIKTASKQTDEQLRPPDELKEILKQTNQVEKLMHFSLHGDKLVK